MLDSLSKYGHGQPELLFVDDVPGERGYFEKAIPSLKQNVKAIVVDEYAHLENFQRPKTVRLLTIDNATDCEISINAHILDQFSGKHKKKQVAVGFDCEWRYDPRTHDKGKVATVQIATSTVVLIIQPSCMGSVPIILQTLLNHKRILKIGKNVGHDIAKLARGYGLTGAFPGKIELGASVSVTRVITATPTGTRTTGTPNTTITIATNVRV